MIFKNTKLVNSKRKMLTSLFKEVSIFVLLYNRRDKALPCLRPQIEGLIIEKCIRMIKKTISSSAN